MTVRQHGTSLAKLSAVYAVGVVAEKAVAFVLLPLYTAFLTLEEMGAVALLTVTTNMVIKFVSPFGSGLVRFYHSPEYAPRAGELVWSLFLLCAAKAAVLGGAFLLLAEWICGLLFSGAEYVPLVRIFAIVLFLSPLVDYVKTLTRLQERAWRYVVVSFIQTAVPVAGVSYLLAVHDAGVYAVAIGLCAGLAIGLIGFLPVFWQSAVRRFDRDLCRAPLRYGYPLLFSSWSNFLIQAGDRYVIRWFLPLAMVGVYSFGYQLSNLLQVLLGGPLSQAVQPLVLKLEGQREEQARFLRQAATACYGLGLFIALGMALLAREGVRLVAQQEGYYAAWRIIPFIAFAHVQGVLGTFVGKGLVLAKKPALISLTVFAAAALNIGLNILLVPQLGLVGAALATVISYVGWNALSVVCCVRYYALHFELKRLLVLSLFWWALAAAAYGIDTGSLWQDLLAKGGLLVLFPLVLLKGRFFREDEMAFLRQVAGRLGLVR